MTLAQTGVPWLESPAHIERCDEGWSWQLRGSCLAYPAELFFPEEEARRTRRQREEQAKRICFQCPVLTACREHALKTPERYGIWGATTPRERGISSGSTRR